MAYLIFRQSEWLQGYEKVGLDYIPSASKSTSSTLMVNLILIRSLAPADVPPESFCTFLKVVAVTSSPSLIRLYACHMSSPALIKPFLLYCSDCLPPAQNIHVPRLEAIRCNITQTHLALQIRVHKASETLSNTASAVLRCKSPWQANLTFLWHQFDGALISLASALAQQLHKSQNVVLQSGVNTG